MNNITVLQKIKWSIIYKTGDNFGVFAECLTKLLQSVDCKRSEILMLPNDDKLFLNTFSALCEKFGISYGYVDDYPSAVENAKGAYLVCITDHTYTSKNFLVKLTFCMENYNREGKVAVVAPISNESFAKLGITTNNLDDVQAQVSRAPKNQIPWAYTLNLIPNCLMFRKSYYENRQLITNLNFKDQILNILYDGFFSVSANDTLVYHFQEHLDHVYDFYQDIKIESKLAVLYRVKVDTERLRDVLVKSLQRSAEFSSNIYVLDDNSKVKIGLHIKEKYPELWGKITKFEKFSRPYDEKRDINELISWAETDGCNWALMLEGDEVVEDKITPEYLDHLLNPVNMEIMGYNVSHYYLWGDDTQWRFDSPWGKVSDTRLCRLVPGKRITKDGIILAQCGYTPEFPSECVRNTSIRIKNYGYILPEDRKSKQEFYEKLNVKFTNGQTLTYGHITQVNGAHFIPWEEDTSITIYTPTNKGGNILYNWLDKCVSFADEVLVGNDSGVLKDEDLQMLSEYSNVRVIPTVMADNFAAGRNAIIKEAKTDYILQLDIDEVVEDYNPLRRMLDVKQFDAWMFTIPNLQLDGGSIITETMRLFKNKGGVKYYGRLHETIDNHVKQNGWSISKSPVKIIHYGYTLQTPDEAFKKMQRYLETNLKQMKDEPMYGMAYYNVALHFLEDDLVDDAIKLLNICIPLQPGFRLGGVELAKSYVRLAQKWLDMSFRGLKDNDPLKQGFKHMADGLKAIQPKNYEIAKGHCLNYFGSRPKEAKWIREHLIDMEHRIEEMNTKALESQAKK